MENENEKCQELANIEYQNMLLNGGAKEVKDVNKKKIGTITNIEEFLEKEKNIESKLPWSKLNKMKKSEKIKIYINNFCEKNNINDKIKTDILFKIKVALNKKKLQRVKDVTYDKETGIIKNIPVLEYNKNDMTFNLKLNDKKQSTLKSLAPKKNSTNRKQKTLKKNSPRQNSSQKIKLSAQEKNENKNSKISKGKSNHSISPKTDERI